MLDLLKLVLIIYLLSLIFSMFCVLVKFLIDTWKWHEKEERVFITKSKFESDLNEEREVEENGSSSDESSEYNTSFIL